MSKQEGENSNPQSRSTSRLSSKRLRRCSEGESAKSWARNKSTRPPVASHGGQKTDGQNLDSAGPEESSKRFSSRGSSRSGPKTESKWQSLNRSRTARSNIKQQKLAKEAAKDQPEVKESAGEGPAVSAAKVKAPASTSKESASAKPPPAPSKASSRRKASAWDTWKYPVYGFGGGVAFLCVTIALYRVLFPYPWVPKKFYKLCETGGCAEFSRLLRSSINAAMDPCDNFYRFVCAGWDAKHNVSLQQHHREEYLASVAAAARAVVLSSGVAGPQTLMQKAARLYHSCESVANKQRDDTGPFRNLLAQAGLSWPQPTPKMEEPNSSSGAFISALLYCHEQLGFDPLFTFELTANKTVTMLPTDVVPDWIHTRSQWMALSTYKETMRRICRHFNDQRSSCDAEVEDFGSLDSGISEMLTVFFREDDGPPMNRSEFEVVASARPFDAWAAVVSQHLNTSQGMLHTPNMRFDIKDPSFFGAVNRALKEFSEESMVLYLAWTAVFTLGPLFSAELSELIAGGSHSGPGDRTIEERCLIFMEKVLGHAVPAAFVQLNVAEEAQEDIRRVTKNIDYLLNITLSKMVINVSMSRDFSKFVTRTNLFGDTGRFSSAAELMQAASDALPEMGDSVLTNYRRAIAFRRALQPGACYVSRLWRPNYYRFYDSRCRTIVVSPLAATLPIYNDQTSSGLRYGAIGSLVAEALFETFYERRHNLLPTQREKVNGIRTCIERSIFKVDTVENMEDAFLLYGGHVALWNAYRSEVYLHDRRLPELEDYSEDKLFFIAFCFIQCGGSAMPRDTLCNIPLKSYGYFADTFSCPLGSAMNLGNRCALY